jgi:hypothetical protein
MTNWYYEVEYKIIKESYDKSDLVNNIFYDKYTFVSTDITFKDSIKYLCGDDVNNKRSDDVFQDLINNTETYYKINIIYMKLILCL